MLEKILSAALFCVTIGTVLVAQSDDYLVTGSTGDLSTGYYVKDSTGNEPSTVSTSSDNMIYLDNDVIHNLSSTYIQTFNLYGTNQTRTLQIGSISSPAKMSLANTYSASSGEDQDIVTAANGGAAIGTDSNADARVLLQFTDDNSQTFISGVEQIGAVDFNGNDTTFTIGDSYYNTTNIGTLTGIFKDSGDSGVGTVTFAQKATLVSDNRANKPINNIRLNDGVDLTISGASYITPVDYDSTTKQDINTSNRIILNGSSSLSIENTSEVATVIMYDTSSVNTSNTAKVGTIIANFASNVINHDSSETIAYIDTSANGGTINVSSGIIGRIIPDSSKATQLNVTGDSTLNSAANTAFKLDISSGVTLTLGGDDYNNYYFDQITSDSSVSPGVISATGNYKYIHVNSSTMQADIDPADGDHVVVFTTPITVEGKLGKNNHVQGIYSNLSSGQEIDFADSLKNITYLIIVSDSKVKLSSINNNTTSLFSYSTANAGLGRVTFTNSSSDIILNNIGYLYGNYQYKIFQTTLSGTKNVESTGYAIMSYLIFDSGNSDVTFSTSSLSDIGTVSTNINGYGILKFNSNSSLQSDIGSVSYALKELKFDGASIMTLNANYKSINTGIISSTYAEKLIITNAGTSDDKNVYYGTMGSIDYKLRSVGFKSTGTGKTYLNGSIFSSYGITFNGGNYVMNSALRLYDNVIIAQDTTWDTNNKNITLQHNLTTNAKLTMKFTPGTKGVIGNNVKILGTSSGLDPAKITLYINDTAEDTSDLDDLQSPDVLSFKNAYLHTSDINVSWSQKGIAWYPCTGSTVDDVSLLMAVLNEESDILFTSYESLQRAKNFNQLADNLIQSGATDNGAELIKLMTDYKSDLAVWIRDLAYNAPVHRVVEAANRVTAPANNHIAGMGNVNTVLTAINDRIGSLEFAPEGPSEEISISSGSESPGYGYWSSVSGSYSTQKGYRQTSSSKNYSGAMTVGIDSKLSETLTAGFGITYQNSKTSFKGFRTGDRTRNYGIYYSLYGNQEISQNIFLRGAANVGFSRIRSRSKRLVGPYDLYDWAENQHNAYSLGFDGSIAFRTRFAKSSITPSIGARYVAVNENRYSEYGSLFNIKVSKSKAFKATTYAGLSFQTNTNIGPYDMILGLSATGSYDIKSNAPKVTAKIQNLPTFRISAQEQAKFASDLGASALIISGNIEYGIKYNFLLSSGFTGHTGSATIRVYF
ncbi:MAG: autotransporter outer membrane beta-barrel domain-containing protein [Rickettsiaceae bacterium]|nr:autotransporter outer membrane beta-barrel domain-containing protein [Rickettsiaceae bacterium]